MASKALEIFDENTYEFTPARRAATPKNMSTVRRQHEKAILRSQKKAAASSARKGWSYGLIKCFNWPDKKRKSLAAEEMEIEDLGDEWITASSRMKKHRYIDIGTDRVDKIVIMKSVAVI
jgi:hypothetical protein